MITAQIDISGMQEVIAAISVSTLRPMKEVTLAESKSVLQTTMDRTQLLTAGKIRSGLEKKFHQFADATHWGPTATAVIPRISIAAGKGNVWLLKDAATRKSPRKKGSRAIAGGPVCHLISQHHETEEDWSLYQSLEKERKSTLAAKIKERLARRGLPRQSWWLMAQMSGVPVRASSVVTGARVRGALLDDVARVTAASGPNSFTISFANSSQASIKHDGFRILQGVLAGREKYFRTNMEKGVFDSAKEVERAYPNLISVT